MQTSQLLLEGVELMLFGMGSVFVFLILLIFCIRLMTFLTGRFVSEPPATPETPAAAIDATTLSSRAVGMSTGIPSVWTAASVSTVMVMAAPAMLMVAPSGIAIE